MIYGPVTSVSRSDVNIVMTVNRKTKASLLTTTPRDAVPIADGRVWPKWLTRIYEWILRSTSENLYDIQLNYSYSSQFHLLPQVDWPSRGIDGKWPEFTVTYAGEVPFLVGRFIWIWNKPRFCPRVFSLKLATMTDGKTKKKSLRPIIKGYFQES